MESKTERLGQINLSKASTRKGTQEERIQQIQVKEYTYCLRCGRKLKNVEARQIGYGKVCLSKIDTTDTRKRLFTPLQI